jgi:hypothetical protein
VLGVAVFLVGRFFGLLYHLLHATVVKDFITWLCA